MKETFVTAYADTTTWGLMAMLIVIGIHYALLVRKDRQDSNQQLPRRNFMNSLMSNRTFRVSLNVFSGAVLSALYVWTFFYLVDTKPFGVSAAWTALLFCIFGCTWMWVGLASSRPDPYLQTQKRMAAAATFALVSVFGSIAVGVTMMQNDLHRGTLSFGPVVMAFGLLPVPRALRRVGLL